LSKSTYLLITNVWNEQDSIPSLFKTIENQTHRPAIWVWIDDGSTDNSSSVIRKEGAKSSIPIQIFNLPPKKKGSLDTLGRAYNFIHSDIKESINVDYMSIADVDCTFPIDYYKLVCDYLDEHPNVGACAGQMKGEAKRDKPMGAGKLVRWSIFKQIDEFWDLAPDSFLNIITLSLGYDLVTIDDLEIDAEITNIFTKRGRFRYGRVNFYIGMNFFRVLQLSLMMTLKKDDGVEFLRGYFQEWGKNTWTTENKTIRYFYSLEFRLRNFLKRRFSIGLHAWPR